jgi:hypothetical protein
MKEDRIYIYYILYLEYKLGLKKLSEGSFNLLKISKSSFEDYKYRFNNDDIFNKKQIEISKSLIRDKKIEDLFNDRGRINIYINENETPNEI